MAANKESTDGSRALGVKDIFPLLDTRLEKGKDYISEEELTSVNAQDTTEGKEENHCIIAKPNPSTSGESSTSKAKAKAKGKGKGPGKAKSSPDSSSRQKRHHNGPDECL